MEEQSISVQMPTNLEITDMFARLENSIKTEIATMRADLGHLLKRVEETEDKTVKQAHEIKE